jgi:membrane glycosyltransferase
MPICNEDVPTVFGGLRATYESLARTDADGWLRLLHPQRHQPARHQGCRAGGLDRPRVGAAGQPAGRLSAGRVYYRWRQRRTKRKAGNVSDFARRWGNAYGYMVVLDADSLMTGECLTTLVRLMEANPEAGILQTAPRACGHETFHARVLQFGSRAYGPLFTAGMHFWQLGESHYWGHNAILRMQPFIEHCGLPALPGNGSLSGEVLSHDFVEAALMRRAGWKVWVIDDLPAATSRSRRTCWPSCSATGAGATATCRTPG